MEYTEQDVLDNMGLVYKIAHFMRPRHMSCLVDFDDLVSEGTLGLINALELWDPEKGAKFSTYAGIRIRGQMLDAHRKSFLHSRTDQRQGLPFPKYVHLDAASYEDDEELFHDLVPGKFLSEQDLINRLDVTLVWEKMWHRLRAGEKKTVKLIRSGMTQVEASRVLGVTESRVSQIYRRALTILRAYHLKSRRRFS